MGSPDLAAKTIAITGASGGVGGAVVRAFLQAGSQVAAVARTAIDPGRLEIPPDVVRDRLATVTADVEDERSVEGMVQTVVSRWGRLDVLVHLVGGYEGSTRVASMERALWDEMIALNLTSTFLCAKHAFRQMEAQGGGAMVTVGTRSVFQVRAGEAAYAAGKAGVMTLTQVLAAEGKDRNIRVNAVVPSIIDTPANRRAMPSAKFERWVQPERLARVVLFLASDEAAEVSGACIPVYGLA